MGEKIFQGLQIVFWILIALLLVYSVSVACIDADAVVVSEKEIVIEGTADYTAARPVRTFVGGVGLCMFVNSVQPENHSVHCENGSYDVSSSQGSDIIEDRDGETVTVVLVEQTYSNGKIGYELVRVEG